MCVEEHVRKIVLELESELGDEYNCLYFERYFPSSREHTIILDATQKELKGCPWEEREAAWGERCNSERIERDTRTRCMSRVVACDATQKELKALLD